MDHEHNFMNRLIYCKRALLNSHQYLVFEVFDEVHLPKYGFRRRIPIVLMEVGSLR